MLLANRDLNSRGKSLKELLKIADDYNPSIRAYIKGDLNETVFSRMMNELFDSTPEQGEALKYILSDSMSDFEFFADKSNVGIERRYMVLKLLESYESGRFPLNELKEFGLTSVQGKTRATLELNEYLNSKL